MLLDIKGISIDGKPRKDGRWQGRYTENGKQKSVYGKNQEEVKLKLSKIVNGEKPKTKAKPEKLMLHSWLDENYKLFRVPTLKSPTTQNNIESKIARLKKLFRNQPLDKLDAIAIQSVLMSVKATAERKVLYTELNAAYEKAVKLRKIKYNPCEAVVLPSHESKHRAALTLADQAKFLKELHASESKYNFLMFFMLGTGTRIEEALALTKKKFIFTDNGCAVKIDSSFTKTKEGYKIKKGTKTTAGERIIPISEKLYKKVMNYAAETENTDRIFNMSYEASYTAIKNFYINAGISNGNALHTLRHTYSTRLEELGVPEIIRGYLLGHRGKNITNNTYTDVQSEYLARYIPTVILYIDALFDTENDTEK
ncbi:MAG: site-specific integrase [Clostridiales bacterium]|jgi:integrase|nr:site-specific integrase [Clostridiales bacterium]